MNEAVAACAVEGGERKVEDAADDAGEVNEAGDGSAEVKEVEETAADDEVGRDGDE